MLEDDIREGTLALEDDGRGGAGGLDDIRKKNAGGKPGIQPFRVMVLYSVTLSCRDVCPFAPLRTAMYTPFLTERSRPTFALPVTSAE